MATREQHFGNHTHYTPAYHFIVAPLGFVYLVWAVVRVVQAPSADTAFALLGAVAVVGAITVSRLQALRVQDRVIRHEERLRLAAILPPDLQAHVPTLRASHLIALRFAHDDEVPALVRQILVNPSMSPTDIKRQVKRWRADWFRT